MTDLPTIVFVTAFEQHAVSAYGVGAVDYLLKPVSAERLAAALGRVNRVRAVGVTPAPAVDELAAVPVELGGRTRFVRRADVRFAEAQGDYVRLHTRGGRHLVRIPISRLEEHWRGVGYVRVHRSFLLAVHAVQELRSDVSGGLLAHTDGTRVSCATGCSTPQRAASSTPGRGGTGDEPPRTMSESAPSPA
jgi:DNA-binding LytR/AlgR family response regulator